MFPKAEIACPVQSSRYSRCRSGRRSIATVRSLRNRPGRSVVGGASSRPIGSWSKSLRAPRLEQLLGLAGPRCLLEQTAGAAAEVAEIDLALIGLLGQALGQ